jgi:hypothetical protein
MPGGKVRWPGSGRGSGVEALAAENARLRKLVEKYALDKEAPIGWTKPIMPNHQNKAAEFLPAIISSRLLKSSIEKYPKSN